MTSADLNSSRGSWQFSAAPAADIVRLVSPSSMKSFPCTVETADGQELADSRISFNLILKGFGLGASLLPSLRAEYKASTDEPSLQGKRVTKNLLYDYVIESCNIISDGKIFPGTDQVVVIFEGPLGSRL